MALILEITSAQARSLGEARRKVVERCPFKVGRYPVGRLGPNDWVLGSDYISQDHAVITCVKGHYFIEGIGKNPIVLNDVEIPKKVLRPLKDGDRLKLEEFEILATTRAVVEDPTPEPDVEKELSRPAGPPIIPIDLDKFLRDPSKDREEPVRPEPPERSNGEIVMDDPFQPPDFKKKDKQRIPINIFEFDPPSPPPEPDPAPREVPAKRAQPDGLSVLLEAAGLTGIDADADLARRLGAVLHIAVEGTMRLLVARSEIKGEIRVDRTWFGDRGNNPLKFSADPAEALQRLFASGSGNRSAEQAFEEAFEDLRFHELAMLKAMQAGFDRVLEHFDPARLEREFPPDAALAKVMGKGRNWDRYKERYDKLRSDPEDTFRRLFLDAFGAAYEKQIAAQKRERRHTDRGSSPPGRR